MAHPWYTHTARTWRLAVVIMVVMVVMVVMVGVIGSIRWWRNGG